MGNIKTPMLDVTQKPTKGKPGPKKKFVKARREEYLAHYAELGTKTSAIEATGFSLSTVMQYAQDHEEFRELEALAEAEFADKVAQQVYRRGVEGWEEPVFGSLEGKESGSGIIGHVTKYSDAMLKLAALRTDKSFTDRVDSNTTLSGSVQTSALDTSKLSAEEKVEFLRLVTKMGNSEE